MSKLEDATNKARNRDANRGAPNAGEMAPSGAPVSIAIPEDMICSHEEVVARLRSGELEAAPQIAELQEGITYHVKLEGYGIPYESKDPRTGEVKEVTTWILGSLKTPGVYFSILSTVQLDRKLPPYVGGEVYITKLGEQKSGNGFRYHDFVVAGPRLADGKRRDWSGKAQQLALTEGAQ